MIFHQKFLIKLLKNKFFVNVFFGCESLAYKFKRRNKKMSTKINISSVGRHHRKMQLTVVGVIALCIGANYVLRKTLHFGSPTSEQLEKYKRAYNVNGVGYEIVRMDYSQISHKGWFKRQWEDKDEDEEEE
jgi:hypothetical protein